jgi:hypothetical protein
MRFASELLDERRQALVIHEAWICTRHGFARVMDLNEERLLRVAVTLVRSYVARNYVPQAELPRLIVKTLSSLRQLTHGKAKSKDAGETRSRIQDHLRL